MIASAMVLGGWGSMVLGKTAARSVPLWAEGAQPVTIMGLLALLSLLPFLVVMVTSFSKVAVVLSLARSALGTQQAPPSVVLTALAAVLTGHIMAPVAEKMFENGRAFYESGTRDVVAFEAIEKISEPLRAFLVKHASPNEKLRFLELSRELRGPEAAGAVSDEHLVVVVPAFILTELKEAFQMGFLIFLPFLVLDMLIANVLIALGMQTLSPTQVSLPFKILLFVAVDGWGLLASGIILGYR